ncbi:toxin-antitoxin system HicB family antitoxin [Nocardia sp. NBC_00511]|uniref:toxin-antitoxin system HicB family antitoxin n=1 Tax=Nocardia sp. NBC_00511 TaxID=2903591 RepID=UPI0030E4468A
MSKLNLRLPDDLHGNAADEAAAAGLSLNTAICEALRDWVTTRARARREDAMLDAIMVDHADTLALIRDIE